MVYEQGDTKDEARGTKPGGADDVYQQLAIENQIGAAAKADTTLKIDADSFDKIGPKAKEILTSAGVESITMKSNGNGGDKIEAKLAKPFEIEQDPVKDGCNKLIVGKNFSADFSKGKNGELILENINGLQADTNLGLANVIKITMKRDAQGNTEIESVGKKGIFSRTRTKTAPGEVMDKAESVLNRLDEMKKTGNKTSMLDLPNLFVA